MMLIKWMLTVGLQASKGGNPLTNNFATLLGDANGQRNFFTVEKMGFN